MTPRRAAEMRRWAVYAVTVVLLAIVAFSADWPKLQETFFDPEIFKDLFPEIVTVAAKNTIILAALAFIGGIVLGLALALMRLSSIRPYRWAALAYIEFFRGIPALLTLILVGFVMPIALGVRVKELLPFLGNYGTPAVGLAIVAGAYLAETIRGGIEAVPKGQMEAARSLGMGHGRAMRSIIIPQAFRVMIPPLTNEFVLLIKDTSLIFVLGVAAADQDLAFFSKAAVQDTFNGTPFIAAAIMYLIITLPLTALSRHLERRGATSSRRRTHGNVDPVDNGTAPLGAGGPGTTNDQVWDG
ncbi:MAG: amino acid ABC transporter permease [Actinomycetota bacterium]|nr:amino acid ABC transporter permease [Actinomycetota bacterium]